MGITGSWTRTAIGLSSGADRARNANHPLVFLLGRPDTAVSYVKT